MNLDKDYLKSRSPKLEDSFDLSEIPEMASTIGKVGFDMAAVGAKGGVQGIVGLPGDLIMLSKYLINMLGGNTDPEKTGAPTAEDVKNYLDENYPFTPTMDLNDPNLKPQTRDFLKRLYNTTEFAGEAIAPIEAVPKIVSKTTDIVTDAAKTTKELVDQNKEVLRPVGSIRMGIGKDELALQQRDGFFSQAEKIIIDKAPNKGSSQQFMKLLERNVKPEEMQRLDMQSFLSSKDTFTKQEIVDYIRENSPQLKRNVLISSNENPEQPQVPDVEFEDAVDEIDEFIQFDRIDFDRPLFSEVVGAESDNFRELLNDELLQVEDELINVIDEMPNAPESGTINHEIELIKKQLEYLKKNYGYSVRIDVHDSIIPTPDVNMTDDGVVARSIADFLKRDFGMLENVSVRNNSYVDADYIIESEDIEQAINNELVNNIIKFRQIKDEYIDNLAYAKAIDDVLNRGEDSGALNYSFMSRNNEYELDVNTTISPAQGRYSIGYRGEFSEGGDSVGETMMLMRETEFHQNRRNRRQNIDPETANMRSFKKYTFGNEMTGETKMLPDNYTVYGFKFTDPELQSAVEQKRGHFEGGELMHMRTTDRVAEEFPNDKSLFVEEIQSDYHKSSRGKKGIYESEIEKTKTEKEELTRDIQLLSDPLEKIAGNPYPKETKEIAEARTMFLNNINELINKKPLYKKAADAVKNKRQRKQTHTGQMNVPSFGTRIIPKPEPTDINDLSLEQLESFTADLEKILLDRRDTLTRKEKNANPDLPFKQEMEMGVKQALQVGIDNNYDRVIFSKHDAVKVYTGSAPVDRYRELQNFVKKYAKEYNGKVETVTVKAGDYEEEFLSIPLTDEFKKAVKDKGQPLYEGATPAVAVGAAAVGMSEDNNGN